MILWTEDSGRAAREAPRFPTPLSMTGAKRQQPALCDNPSCDRPHFAEVAFYVGLILGACLVLLLGGLVWLANR